MLIGQRLAYSLHVLAGYLHLESINNCGDYIIPQADRYENLSDVVIALLSSALRLNERYWELKSQLITSGHLIREWMITALV